MKNDTQPNPIDEVIEILNKATEQNWKNGGVHVYDIVDLREEMLTKLTSLLAEKERENVSALGELVGALHKEFVFTGLATEEQWNEAIAPRLRDLRLIIEGHNIGTPTARVYKYPDKSVWY